MLVQVKHIVGRGQDHLSLLGEDDGLQHVDRLGDVGHVHPIAVLVEDIQRNGGDHRVAHGVLLVEEAGIRAGLHLKPGAPLVHDQADALVGVVLVHDRGVVRYQLVHPGGDRQGFNVIVLREFRGPVLVLPAARNGVEVQAQAVHAERGVLHHDLGPVGVPAVGTAGDLVQLVASVLAAEILVPAVHVRVVLRPHDAAAAPAFVADAPVLHAPAVLPAVGPALAHHGGVPVGVQVFHPLAHFLRRAAAHVARDVGLAAHLAAQFHEFVGAEGVVLRHAAPVGVHHVAALLLRADAVPPVVLIREAAARPAQHRHMDGLHGLHDVRADAVHVGDIAVLPDEDTPVDAVAQVLREIAVDIPGNRPGRLVPFDIDPCHLFFSPCLFS